MNIQMQEQRQCGYLVLLHCLKVFIDATPVHLTRTHCRRLRTIDPGWSAVIILSL